jgi:hypothetical protein
MVLRSPPTAESIIQYALPVSSSKSNELTGEDNMARKITKNLDMVRDLLVPTLGESP